MVPEWGRRFASFLEKVRHNDWTFSPGTVLSQWYTEGHINKGIKKPAWRLLAGWVKQAVYLKTGAGGRG